ncbi:MAG: putative hydrolase, family [Polaromonas sp.]|nr:putative hydrolase, family [Polaromonas sp.]
MSKTTSYGVLIFNERGELLVAHVTGQNKWDIPKGGADPGETPVQAAARETLEETGIVLAPEQLEDLGHHAYLRTKDLHLFRAQVTALACDISQCVCTSFFPHHRTGRPTPEVDGFQWIHPRDMASFCSPRLVAAVTPFLPPPSVPFSE